MMPDEHSFIITVDYILTNTTMSTPIKRTFTIGNNLTVNRMGYGAMRITGKGIWGPPADKAEALKVLKRTIELGINFIDTADSYGPHVSEELIAEALHPYPADLVIGTKGGLLRTGPDEWPVNANPAYLKQALEGSLKRLKVEQIDLYQLHRIDPKVPAEETFAFLKQAQQEGKIKHIGLSEVTIDQIKQAQEFFEVTTVQNMYSVDNRKWESVLKYTQEQNIGFIPWFPLNAGNVTAQEKLQLIARKKGVTVHQLALSYPKMKFPNWIKLAALCKANHINIIVISTNGRNLLLQEI
jgi:pyridoxine 4-dehydrogenase